MRILRSFLSATFYNLIFRSAGLYTYELMKRYNRWLAITAAASQRGLIPRFSSRRRRRRSHHHCRLNKVLQPARSFVSADIVLQLLWLYDSSERRSATIARILCPCGRTLIKCWRLAALRVLPRRRKSNSRISQHSLSLRRGATKKSEMVVRVI